MLKTTLVNLKGGLVFATAFLNLSLWILPLLGLTILKLVVPHPAFRRKMMRGTTAVGEHWISCNTLLFRWVNGTRYDVSLPDGLSRDNWYLLIANHQTWVDIIVLQTVFNRRIPFLKFFVKQQLVWVPVLGIALWALDMPFMKRHSKAYLQAHPEQRGRDLENTRRACEKFHDVPTSVINFVEGTRFTEAKREQRDSPYRRLLPPRSGGVAVSVASMGQMFDAVLDVTIHYPGGAPEFWDVMCGRLSAVTVEVESIALDDWLVRGDYVNDREHRRTFHRWLTALWARKDARLAALDDADADS